MQSRVYFASLAGFDTHAGQTPTHPNFLRELAGGVAAFLKDPKEQGSADRTAGLLRRLEQLHRVAVGIQ
jgi:uncharacterized protein (DUF1501 family)